MLTFAKDIVDKADVDSGSVRVGALIYSNDVEIQFYLNQYTTGDEIKAAIDEITYMGGGTNSADALKTMHRTLFNQSSGDRPDAENIAFMITDSISNIKRSRSIPEAEAARAKGIHVYAIGIGLDDTRELEGMASFPPKDSAFNVKDFDELGGLVDTIFGGSDSEACAPNEPPVANAGSDVSIQMPIDFVTLDGRKSTDDAAVMMYQWIQISGSTNILTQREDNAVLNLSKLTAGVYVFTLTVFDVDRQSDDDDVTVTVKDKAL